MIELRGIVAYGPGHHVFRKEDYPWLVVVRGFAVGGEAGKPGKDGEDGYVLLELYGESEEAP